MTALAFLFAVFLARPCPFYILDEVEAALDDLNIDRFLTLLRKYADRAQFIVVTHQKRTMEAADCLYGVSMAGNGVSKVVSRRCRPPRRRDADGRLARRDRATAATSAATFGTQRPAARATAERDRAPSARAPTSRWPSPEPDGRKRTTARRRLAWPDIGHGGLMRRRRRSSSRRAASG